MIRFGSPSVPSTIESSADMSRSGEQPAADLRRHQPRIQVPPRQTGHLAHGLRGRRARPRAKMLHPPASCRQPGQHCQASHRGLSTLGRCRQSQARKLVHDRSEARPVDVLIRSVSTIHPFTESNFAWIGFQHGAMSKRTASRLSDDALEAHYHQNPASGR